ncbi:MAG: site-2 protease family protein, partial [Methylophilus sp.]
MMSALAFIVAIGVLVTIHEFGHYLAARSCGVRVLKFSIGFGKPIFQYQRT